MSLHMPHWMEHSTKVGDNDMLSVIRWCAMSDVIKSYPALV